MMPAAERLAASRERLRQALAPRSGAGGAAHGEPIIETLARAWALPQLALLAELARGAVAPLAQRRPLAVVLVAAAAGALVVKLRPWRSLLRPALLAGALPLLTQAVLRVPPGLWSHFVAQLSKKA